MHKRDSSANQQSEVSLPLVIAVTGHRDLVAEEIPAIEDRVKKLFIELGQRYPANRLVVMSPLAEGSDCLVGKIAVEMEIELVVPLPKPVDKYLQGFRSEEAVEKFRSIYSKADTVFELPQNCPPTPDHVDPGVWESDYPYATLGAYLSAHCHILLAIWDGKPSDHLGGTAQVVKFHHDDAMPGIVSKSTTSQQMLVDDESDLVFHIVCSRSRENSEPHPDLKPLDWFWFTKDETNPRSKELPLQHELIFRRSTEFSEDAIALSQKIEEEAYSLIDDYDDAALPVGIRNIDRMFGIADTLAIHYQRKSILTLRITHVLAFLMGLMFILYSDLESSRSYLILFLGIFGLAWVVHALSSKGNWNRRYLDYRTLAEGLRVQFYWAAAGVNAESKWKFPHDNYLQSQDPEFGWIRNVMRVAGFRCDAECVQNPQNLEFVLQQWVGGETGGQLNYFRIKARDRHNKSRLTGNLGRLSLIASVLIVFLFVLLGPMLPESIADILTVIMGSTLLLFGVREGYAYATAEKELMKQYEYMLGIYSSAQRRLDEASDDEEKRQILLALGRSALSEHSDWILMHRERTLDEGEIWRLGS